MSKEEISRLDKFDKLVLINRIIQLEALLSKDTEILDWIDEQEVFHIDKNHSGIKNILMCLCDRNHEETESDNIRDLITKAKGEHNGK